jgi:hypothetical protein
VLEREKMTSNKKRMTQHPVVFDVENCFVEQERGSDG